MTLSDITHHIREKESFLCVGIDPVPERIPEHLLDEEDPLFEFSRAIVDATHTHCVAYKPNTAFFEAEGPSGWRSLSRLIQYIKAQYPKHFTIADAKRGDIGNTARQYARAFFKTLPFDSVTVAPYMGADSVEPFLEWPGKYAILLALTSNEGAADYQLRRLGNERLYEQVLKTSQSYRHSDRLMYVVGATQAEYLEHVRRMVPDSFLLIPGVGSQGGSVSEVCEAACNRDGGVLINVSRSIIYASGGMDFATAAGEAASDFRGQMSSFAKRLV